MTARNVTPAYRGVNYYVPSLSYAEDVNRAGEARCVIASAPATADADGILAAQSIATASSTTTFASTYTALTTGLAQFGRNLTVVASGAATSTVTVRGLDYLNQPVTEQLTLNGTTAVQGVKAFKWITYVSWGATSGTTINLGWGNKLGIPYRSTRTTLLHELVSGAAPTAGALSVGVATQTATSADPRGLYTPDSSVVPDGSRTYDFVYAADIENNLHGAAQYYA